MESCNMFATRMEGSTLQPEGQLTEGAAPKQDHFRLLGRRFPMQTIGPGNPGSFHVVVIRNTIGDIPFSDTVITV